VEVVVAEVEEVEAWKDEPLVLMGLEG